MVITLQNDALNAELDTNGAKLLKLQTKEGFEILQSYDPSQKGDNVALFPLLPLANRVKGDSYELNGKTITLPQHPTAQEYLHGDGWVSNWELVSTNPTEATLGLKMSHDNGYDYSAYFSLKLVGKSLMMELAIKHLGLKPRLYGLGLHPYFVRDQSTKLHFAHANFYEDGACHLPKPAAPAPERLNFNEPKDIPEEFINHLYQAGAKVTIERGGHCISLESDCPYLMLYTLAGAKFIAIEPQSHVTDAVHCPDLPGLHLLAQGEMMQIHTKISID